jgi:hypothetical protein
MKTIVVKECLKITWAHNFDKNLETPEKTEKLHFEGGKFGLGFLEKRAKRLERSTTAWQNGRGRLRNTLFVVDLWRNSRAVRILT